MKKGTIGIYKIVSPSGRIYIGQSINIEARFLKYKRLGCKRQLLLYNSFLKYGVAEHSLSIIESCTVDDLNDREIFYINMYQTFNSDFGLNLKAGGLRGGHSDVSKAKIGKAHKGKFVSNESRNKMSIAQRKRSKEISALISKRNIGNQYGRKVKPGKNQLKLEI